MTPKQLIKTLRKLARRRSWEMTEAPAKGSHRKVVLNGRITIIPMHSSDLKIGTFKEILRQLNLSQDDI